MPRRQRPRTRPYLERRAKRPRTTPPSQPPYPTPPTLLTLPEDIFLRIITLLQSGAHLRGPVLQSARHAFPLAQVSTACLSRYRAALHTIDAASSTFRDPGAPCLLTEHHPRHIRSLVALAGPTLRTLRLPRYEQSQHGAEAVLPVVPFSGGLTNLSFVDHGRVDHGLARKIFGASLEAVCIERPSRNILRALAASPAPLRELDLSAVPFGAMDSVVEVLRLRGRALRRLALRFDQRSAQVVEDSGVKPGETAVAAGLRRFVARVWHGLSTWAPHVATVEVSVCDERVLQHARVNAGDVLARGLGEMGVMVREKRRLAGGREEGTDVRVVKLCGRALKAAPWVFQGEVRVRLPGYELVYGNARNPQLRWFQMTKDVQKMGVAEVCGLTDTMETLNVGDRETMRGYERIREDLMGIAANAKMLQRVIVRVAICDADMAVKVMRCVTDVLKVARWVREVEMSHEIVCYKDREEFGDMVKMMDDVRVLHFNAQQECFGRCGKIRVTGFIRCLPSVVRMLGEKCAKLEVLYVERLGDARIISGRKTREEMIRKLGESDVAIGTRLGNVDCSSLKGLVVMWIEQINNKIRYK